MNHLPPGTPVALDDPHLRAYVIGLTRGGKPVVTPCYVLEDYVDGGPTVEVLAQSLTSAGFPEETHELEASFLNQPPYPRFSTRLLPWLGWQADYRAMFIERSRV